MNAPAPGGGPIISSSHQRDRQRRPAGLRRHLGLLGHRSELAGLLGLGAALALVAACGSTSSTGGTTNPTATAVAAGGSSPSSSSTTTTVMVGTATVSGSSEQVLTESDGWTLYYNTDDTPTTASCTGACAGTWPPLLLASGSPTGPSSLTGTLTAVTTGNGRQVEYNGHPLYIYAGDSGADQSNGEGKGGVWYVATPSLSSSGTSASAASAPGGY